MSACVRPVPGEVWLVTGNWWSVAGVMTYAVLFAVVDKRNGIPSASPGDKSYQAPEFSAGFHNDGSTLPPSNFGYAAMRMC